MSREESSRRKMSSARLITPRRRSCWALSGRRWRSLRLTRSRACRLCRTEGRENRCDWEELLPEELEPQTLFCKIYLELATAKMVYAAVRTRDQCIVVNTRGFYLPCRCRQTPSLPHQQTPTLCSEVRVGIVAQHQIDTMLRRLLSALSYLVAI